MFLIFLVLTILLIILKISLRMQYLISCLKQYRRLKLKVDTTWLNHLRYSCESDFCRFTSSFLYHRNLASNCFGYAEP